jgi:diguanylate cyclase (GGDEF)-like protein/PAS domain S-box-containing protein
MSQAEKRAGGQPPDSRYKVSEQRYRRLFESTRDGIILLDAGSGEILAVNRSLVKLLGFPRKEMLGKKLWEGGFFSSIKAGRALFRELQQKKVCRYEDLALETKAGHHRAVEFVTDTYLVGPRRVIQCNLCDITEWKTKVDQLGMIARIPAENPNPVLRFDRDGNILFANKASRSFLSELGITNGGRVPKFWRGVVSDVLKNQRTSVIEAQSGGRTYSYFVAPVAGANYVNLYGFDVTPRKQEEEARRAAEANYRALVEQLPAISYVDFADGVGLSQFVSPQIKSILGISPEEWMVNGDDFWANMIHPDDRERAVSAYQDTLDTGQPFEQEYRMIARDGHMVWIDDHAVFLEGAHGQSDTLLGVMFDITERKQAEALQEAVYRIAIATETTKSLSDLYPQIHEIISAVMPAENFYITLYDERKNILRFPYFRDAQDEPYLGEIEPGKGLTAYVLRTGRSLLCTQAVHDELERKGAVKLLGVPSAIWLGVPLIIEGKTIGAMVVQHYTNPEAYREREQHILEFVSSQVAIAISRKQTEDALRGSERHLQNAERIANLGSCEMDIATRKSVWSAGFFRMCGFEPGAFEPSADMLISLIHPEDRNWAIMLMDQAIAEMRVYSNEYRIVRPNGTTIWVEVKGEVECDAAGNPEKLLSSFLDITERKQAQALQEAVYLIAIATETTQSLSDLYPQIHEIISAVMPAENFYIALYDETRKFLRFPYFRDVQDEPFLGDIEPGKGLTEYVLKTGKSLLCTQAVHDELEHRGTVILIGAPSAIWLGVPLIIEGKTIGAMVVQHYTNPEAYGEREQHILEFVSSQVAIAISRKQTEEKLRLLSTHDILTGLYNRSFFEGEMERLERGRQFPVSIMMADVDHLKEVNDRDGHAAGDMLLRRLAQVLSAAFRAEDVLARIGGDEFAVLLPNTGALEAKNTLERVRSILQEHNTSQVGPRLQISFGVSTAEKSAALAEVLKQADANMYAEKRANFGAPKRPGRKKIRQKEAGPVK